jgi:mycothiol synthase
MPDDQILGLNAPQISGLIFRRFRGEADYARMVRVLRESERPEEVQDEDIPGAIRPSAHFDPYQDMILVEIEGDLIGYGRITRVDDSGDEWVYSLRGYLLPKWRRRGIGGAMLSWLEDRVRHVAWSHGEDKPVYTRAGAKQHQEGLAILLERSGYQPLRYFYVMVRPTLEDILDLPLPPGIEVRPALPEHFRAIWKAIDETARDEWGYRPFSEKDYQAWLKDPLLSPQLWQIAWDISKHRVVGHVLTYIDHAENAQANRKRGYTEGIGVLRDWRMRGLASALIMLSLKSQKAAGMEESGLVVDCASATGAVQLYERSGFHVVERNAVYRKRINR